MRHRATKRLRDARAACLEIIAYTERRSLQDYLTDRTLRLVIERLLEIVGEALNQAVRSDPALSTSIPEAHVVIGMRNRIIHGYDEIKDDVVWDAARNDVPELLTQIDQILGTDPGVVA
jgi:uncharacterized protein with HEPN domain